MALAWVEAVVHISVITGFSGLDITVAAPSIFAGLGTGPLIVVHGPEVALFIALRLAVSAGQRAVRCARALGVVLITAVTLFAHVDDTVTAEAITTRRRNLRR